MLSSPQDGGSGESREPSLQALALLVTTCSSATDAGVLACARRTKFAVALLKGEANTVALVLVEHVRNFYAGGRGEAILSLLASSLCLLLLPCSWGSPSGGPGRASS